MPGREFVSVLFGRRFLQVLVWKCRDPTFDKRVIEFCFAIPVEQYVCKGKDRWLIRRAMEGLLPPKVLWNPVRGRQGSDLLWRVRKELDEIQIELKNFKRSELIRHYLNVEKMEIIDK